MARGWKFGVKLVDELYYLYPIVKSKALIKCVVSKQLIFAFVLAYAKIRVSQEVTHIHWISIVTTTTTFSDPERVQGVHTNIFFESILFLFHG